MLPALAWALASSSILYLVSPRFPNYQVTSFRILSFSVLHFLLTLRINCTVEVEVQVDNINFIGAQVHGALVDMYYPDYMRELHHIGHLRDKHNHHYRLLYEDVEVSWDDDDERPAGQAVPENPSPLHLPPRKTVLMYDNVITVENLGPATYLTIVKDAIANRGTIDMLSTGVAHVKTSLLAANNATKGVGKAALVPLTVTVLCDNKIDTLKFPAQIVERTCSPVDLYPGWLDMEVERHKLEKEIVARYKANKSVLVIRGGVDMLGGQRRDEPESVEHWHDF